MEMVRKNLEKYYSPQPKDREELRVVGHLVRIDTDYQRIRHVALVQNVRLESTGDYLAGHIWVDLPYGIYGSNLRNCSFAFTGWVKRYKRGNRIVMGQRRSVVPNRQKNSRDYTMGGIHDLQFFNFREPQGSSRGARA